MIDDTNTAAPPQHAPARDTGSLLLAAGGLAAAFGAASCCALPLLLGSLGLGSAWLVTVAWFAAPHRLALLAVAIICLASGGGVPLASPTRSGLRTGCRVWKPGDHGFRDVRPVSRRGFGRARFHVCVSAGGEFGIDDHLSKMRQREGRDDANRRLPIFLPMHGLRDAVAS